ncbi:MAG: VCBS repeat-containing protein, partial [Planctomycetes bacterium]|nr:VCBS repeat-containing protein [Planctomycetota bacterium]
MRPRTCSSYLIISLILGCSVAGAQQTRQWIDAPMVAFDEHSRVDDLGDLDGDGDLDGIGWWWIGGGSQDAMLSCFRNDGNGTFAPSSQVVLPLLTFPGNTALQTAVGDWDADLGDFDQDGDLDYALVIGRTVFIVLLDGPDQTPVIHHTSTLSASSFANSRRSLRTGDFDADGMTDIVLATHDGLAFWHNAGAASFVPSPLTLNASFEIMARANVDADPADEIVVVANGAWVWFIDFAAGAPTLTTAIPTTGNSVFRPCVGDVDGDGDEDLVLFRNALMGGYQLLRRTGVSTFSPEYAWYGGPADRLVDVDGDGDLDGVCCSSGGGGGPVIPPTANAAESTFRISLNDGSGAFTTSWTTRGLGAARLASAVDLDADGDVDLVAGRCIYFADGPLDEPIAQGNDYSGSFYARPLVADCDGDADVDILVNAFPQFRSNDGVTFASTGASPFFRNGNVAFMREFIAAKDFNGDGLIDVVAEPSLTGPATGNYELFVGNGNGRFESTGSILAGGGNLQAANGLAFARTRTTLAADLDGDGDVDLCVGESAPQNGSALYLNDGTGALQVIATTIASRVDFVGDLNDDGLPDLVCADGDIRLGLGGPTFDAPLSLGVALNTVLGVRDFDDDGDVDMLCRRGTDGMLLILENLGWLSFAPHATITASLGTGFADLIDVTGDGLKDLVFHSTDNSASGLTVVKATGPGFSAWSSRTTFVAHADLSADLDDDGDQDFVGLDIVRTRSAKASNAGSKRQYGHATAGSQGFLPRLGASGPFKVGDWASVQVTGGVGGAGMLYV